MNNLRGKVVGKDLVDERCLRPSEFQSYLRSLVWRRSSLEH